jgi:hypothetical protein
MYIYFQLQNSDLYCRYISSIEMPYPSLAIVATTKGIVDQTALELDWYCCPPLEGQSMLKRFLAVFLR